MIPLVLNLFEAQAKYIPNAQCYFLSYIYVNLLKILFGFEMCVYKTYSYHESKSWIVFCFVFLIDLIWYDDSQIYDLPKMYQFQQKIKKA